MHIEHRIDNELTGPVIRHLPSSIDLNDRNIASGKHVFGLRIQPKRKHGRVF
jgi:hypothetical protein